MPRAYFTTLTKNASRVPRAGCPPVSFGTDKQHWQQAASGTFRARRGGGFTLVELIMVVITAALLAGLAIPRWAGAMQHYRLDLAAQRVTNDLALAQARANFGSAAVTVAFTPASGAYQILGMADMDRGTGTYTTNLSADPYRATISSATFGGASQLTFDGYGRPAQGGTVVITVGNRQRTITVDASSGKTSIQ
jgi:Tfp pilus assembly protein FimT